MRIYITGRDGSGKSTFIGQASQEINHPDHHDFIESRLKSIVNYYEEGDQIVVIDTPAILCSLRKGMSFSIKNANYENDMLKFVTELPNCTIIRNDSTIDTLRVQTKKFIKKYL